MTHINFDSVSGRAIVADYELPENSNVVIVNKTSGETLGRPMTQVPAASGTLKIEVPSDVPAGDYYLKAQDKSGTYIAQSVVFQIA